MGCGGGKATGDNKGGDPHRSGSGTPKGRNSAQQSSKKLLDVYDLGDVLGQGAFGIVYLCRKRDTNEEFAVKMIDKVESSLVEIQKEAEMLQLLNHQTIANLRDIFYEKVFVCMVMELYRGGDLIEGMQAHWKKHGPIPMAKARGLCKQLIDPLVWLHNQSVVHRDIKGDNYLMSCPGIIDPNCKVVLSDFGTVRKLKADEVLSKPCGTKIYWPPEFFDLKYGLKVDVWAAGIVIHGLVEGKFPFKGEKEVKERKPKHPLRCPAECEDLIVKLLTKEEKERPTSAEAQAHKWLAGLAGESSQGCGEQEASRGGFVPEHIIREGGANAGVAERRRELVERIEDAAAAQRDDQGPSSETKRVSAMTPVKQLLGGANFEVVDRRTNKTMKMEWWPRGKVESKGLLEMQGMKDAATEGDATNNSTVKRMLEEHGISTNKFGIGQAKSLDHLVAEIQSGASRLMLDATQHKNLVRVVDIVLLRISAQTAAGEKYLVLTGERYADGRTREGLNRLPGTKKEPHENAVKVAQRVTSDMLNMNECEVVFDYSVTEVFEEEDESPSYPGVRTVYRKEIVEGKVTATQKLDALRFKSGSVWSHKDTKQFTRALRWQTEKQCQAKGVKLRAPEAGADVSGLVHAPVGWEEEELTNYLKTNGVDTKDFGQGRAKTLKDFSNELVKGESSLMQQPDGRIVRIVDIVLLTIFLSDGKLLVEAAEVNQGDTRVVERLPGTKRRPDENQFLAAQRYLTKTLKIQENLVAFDPKCVKVVEEETISTSFPGFPTVYRKRIIKGEIAS